MGPRVFYRVEDASSRALYVDGEGFVAEDTSTAVHFAKQGAVLWEQLARHLDWGNRRPTPFISVYRDEPVAWKEARRRVRDGKRDVRVYQIDPSESEECVDFRNVRLLADKLGLFIERVAWHNSMHEWIFLHRVPDSAVVGWKDVGWKDVGWKDL